MSLELFFINETLPELKKTYTQFRSGNGYKDNKAPKDITKEEIIKLILSLYNIAEKKRLLRNAKEKHNDIEDEIFNRINDDFLANIKAN